MKQKGFRIVFKQPNTRPIKLKVSSQHLIKLQKEIEKKMEESSVGQREIDTISAYYLNIVGNAISEYKIQMDALSHSLYDEHKTDEQEPFFNSSEEVHRYHLIARLKVLTGFLRNEKIAGPENFGNAFDDLKIKLEEEKEKILKCHEERREIAYGANELNLSLFVKDYSDVFEVWYKPVSRSVHSYQEIAQMVQDYHESSIFELIKRARSVFIGNKLFVEEQLKNLEPMCLILCDDLLQPKIASERRLIESRKMDFPTAAKMQIENIEQQDDTNERKSLINQDDPEVKPSESTATMTEKIKPRLPGDAIDSLAMVFMYAVLISLLYTLFSMYLTTNRRFLDDK